MIYGIAVNPANQEKRTGPEWYTFNLIQAMKKTPLMEGESVILYSQDPLRPELAELPKGWESKVLGWPMKRAWIQGRLSLEMLREPPNVLFVPGHRVPRLHPHNKNKHRVTVSTIHDVGFKRHGNLYDSKERRYQDSATRFAVKHCAKILTPSDFSKHELIKLYGAKEEQIHVTMLAPDAERFQNISKEEVFRVQRKYQLSNSTFLTVSRIEAKKNIGTLVRAFEAFKARRGVGDPFQLVLAGKPGFGYQNIKGVIDASPAKDSIKELGWVPDEDVPALMAGAYAYVHPSWYEGLGISVLEAMAAGTPLICSAIPALYEAAGDAALYFPPNEIDTLTRLMNKLLDEPTMGEELVEKGKARLAQFSWKKTAEETWEVLREFGI